MTAEDRLQFIYVMKAANPSKAASRESWTADDHETFDLHWANLQRLRDQGKLILAGRAQDPDGTGIAICILEVESQEEARRIFESEPFILRGFATGSLHPYQVALSRNPL